MQTITDIEGRQSTVPPSFPIVKLLYLGGTGPTSAACVPRHGVTRIGRSVSDPQDMALPTDRAVSEIHARLELVEHRPRSGSEALSYSLRLVDEGSKNGCYVNGQRADLALLQDGDVLRIGNSLLLVRDQAARPLDANVRGILGDSAQIGMVRYLIARASRSDVPVLVLGEPGVGKELAARGLHQLSGRRGALVSVNCAAIPDQLAESLLFGHERGAFSGADVRRDGFFVAADEGTLFLDEVGELALTVQAKLLRVLQEGQITPVGRTKPVSCSVRIVAATNRNLTAAVSAGQFRGDLYSRLQGDVMTLPPLRSRREDILPLLLHLIAAGSGRNVQLSPRLAEALLLHHWPYNVRELAQLAQCLKLDADAGQELDLPSVASRLASAGGEADQADQPNQVERTKGAARSRAVHGGASVPMARAQKLSPEILQRLGREHGWNISLIARLAGRSRRQVRRWIEEYSIERKPNQE